MWDGKVTESFTDRLQRAARNGTGYLEVNDATRERRGWVFLEDHNVVAVLVDGYQPRLARRLTASEFVSVADMGDVLTVTKDEYDPRIAVECVARGLVDAVTMKVLYREFMLSAASFLDEWELGDSQWVAGVPPWEGRSTAVPVPLLVNAMIRRKQHWARLWTELSTVTIPDRVPVRTGPVSYRPETPDEAAVLRAVDGRRTVDQVAGECGFTRFQTGHLMAALMSKKVLDLFPVNGPQPTSSFLRVEAGYYAASEPVPEPDPPAADVSTDGRLPRHIAPRRLSAVPMSMSVRRPPEAHPVSSYEIAHVVTTGPVAADHPEGNIVTQHLEAEDVDGVARSGYAPGDVLPVADERPRGGVDESHPAGPDAAFQPAPNLSEFFVSSFPGSTPVQEQPPPTGLGQQHDLPPLPAITGGPSDFYAVLPSTLPRRAGGVLLTALPALPMAGHVAEHEPDGSDPTTLGETARAEQMPELYSGLEVAAGPDVEPDVEPDLDWAVELDVEPAVEPAVEPELEPDVRLDTEVAQLRDELLRLASERKAAVENAAVSHEQAVLHSADAEAAAVLVEQADMSIARLTRVTSEASAMAVNHFEGLQLARDEDARIAVLRAQVDEDTERARRALVLGQHNFDESSAAHASLEHDLQRGRECRETFQEAWTVATDGAARSAANARHAQAAVDECDQLFEEARERLTEMANAQR